jgi:putative SOS response-associated peptidase YedK
MCGRYTLIANAEAIRRLFQTLPFDERLVVPRYNIAPTQPIVVVRPAPKGRELVPMRWGLIPGWAKDPAAVSLLIIARADGIAEKPAFANAFRRRRCLIPASGFYEWQARGSGPRQPYLVRPGNGELIAFAGLSETWSGNDGSEIDTAAIVTVPANERLSAVHHRMPAVIAPEDFDVWLSSETEPFEAEALLKPAPEEVLTFVPVSTQVNAVANDDPSLWEEMSGPAEAGESVAQRPRQMQLF